MKGMPLSVETMEAIQATGLSPEEITKRLGIAQETTDIAKVDAIIASSLADTPVVKTMPKVSIDLGDMDLGDFENLEAGSVSALLKVLDVRLRIEGVADEDVPATIRKWKLDDLDEIGETIRAAVDSRTNPKRQGKN